MPGSEVSSESSSENISVEDVRDIKNFLSDRYNDVPIEIEKEKIELEEKAKREEIIKAKPSKKNLRQGFKEDRYKKQQDELLISKRNIKVNRKAK